MNLFSSFTTPSTDELYDLCGFNGTAENFWSKFIFHGKWKTLTPCAEFGIILFEQFLLLFCSVIHIVGGGSTSPLPNTSIKTLISSKILGSTSPLPNTSVKTLISSKILVNWTTSLLLLVLLLLSQVSKYSEPTIYIIEYSILAFVWIIFGFVDCSSLLYNLWKRSFWLNLCYSFVSKSFIIICVQRWIKYGFTDPRCYLIFAIVMLHFINYFGHIIEWRIAKNLNNFQQLTSDENIQLNSGNLNNFQQLTSDENIQLNSGVDEDASLFSKLFFCWTNLLVKKGYHGQLKNINDLFPLPSSLKVEIIEKQFVESSPSYFTDAWKFSLPRALFNTFGIKYLALGILRLIGDCLSFAGPILLHYLVTELEDGDKNIRNLA
uniref:Uncharacterized protein n=1 Tax=Panagrolaimus sp. JU765 TaxID=591449 RepID=A0AC34QIR7_9BILA